MAVVTNEQLFQRYFDECANGGNLDLCDEIFAADYQHHDPANPDPRPVVGPQGVKAHLESLKGGFPDLVFDVEDTISDGDQIIVKWTARGTNTGDYFGMPATGKSDAHGDLYATVEVQLPRDLTAEQRKHFEALQKLESGAKNSAA